MRLCPHCATDCDAQTYLDGNPNAEPAPGDLSVCGHCAELLVFTESLQLRLLDFDEYVALCCAERAALDRAREAVKAYHLSGGVR